MAQLLQKSNVGVGDQHSISRRTANNHPNLWEDDFIQSLSSPYGASSYRGRVETLMKEIKDIFGTLGNAGEIGVSPYDIIEKLSIVDVIQRLGIDRYFQKEIKAALDCTYKYWTEKGISCARENDLNTTALAFRVLRLGGYDVSADVFEIFKDDNGQFFSPPPTQEEEGHLRSMLSLYRASELSFPGEKIMKDAKIFSSPCLEEAVKESKELKQKSLLLTEIEYILKYPWSCRVPRWEARSTIEIYKSDIDAWMVMEGVYKMPNALSKKILELAVLDFNILQALHQSELKLLSKWWNESKARQLNFFRHRHVEFYFWWACGLFEPELCASRMGFAKLSTMFTLIDDVYDTHGTIDELRPFTTALITWDKSIVESLPDFMKTSFAFAHQTLEEIAIEAEKKQGPLVRKYMGEYWKSYILSYLKEAEWIAANHIPSFDEYFKIAVTSSAMQMVVLISLILTDSFIISDNIMERVNRLETLASTATRLVDDSKDFQDEKLHGEEASCIECYVKDNPGSSREDALNYVNTMLESTIDEINWEFLRREGVATSCKRHYFDAGVRSLCFLFKNRDGLTFSNEETRDAIIKILVEPINM